MTRAAAPSEIENQITQKIEASLQSIQGVQSISSTAREGSSETGIEFDIGIDIIEALNDVKNAVDQARGSLPDGILEPQVFKAETSSEAIAYFAVAADDLTLEQIVRHDLYATASDEEIAYSARCSIERKPTLTARSAPSSASRAASWPRSVVDQTMSASSPSSVCRRSTVCPMMLAIDR